MVLIGFINFININKFKYNKIILTGGGRKNNFLIKILKENINKDFDFIDNLNINGDLVESQMFAYIGVRSIKKLTISSKYTTGVNKNISGGKLFIPS